MDDHRMRQPSEGTGTPKGDVSGEVPPTREQLQRELERERAARRRADEEHEHTLAEVESRLARVLASIHDVYFETALSGRLLCLSDSARQLGEPDLGRLIGADMRAFCGDPSVRRDLLTRLQRDGEVTEFELDFRMPDGKTRWALLSASLLDGAPEPTLYGTIREVTEDRLNEQLLRDSEAALMASAEALWESDSRFRSIVEASPMGILVYNLLDGRLVITAANPAADRILERRSGELVGKTIEEAFPAVASTPLAARMHKIAADGGSWSAQRVAFQDDSVSGTFELHAFQIARGCVALMFLDVSEAIRSEAELRASNDRFQELIENINDVVFTVTADGTMSYASPVIESMLGYPVEEVLGRRFSDFIHEEDRPRMREEFQEALRGVLFPSEYRVKTKDRGIIWVRSSSKPIVAHGVVLALHGTLADVTERRKAEEERGRLQAQLQQAQKLESLGLLAGGVAHDFNNLLCGMLGSADLAILDLGADHPSRHSIEQVKETAQRATELCRQLLAYSGKGRFVSEPVNLSELVGGMGQLFSVSISKKTTLRYELSSDVPAVEADATQLRQVVLNLIVNASEAIGDETGVIRLATRVENCDREALRSAHIDGDPPPGPYVVLEVSDTGSGMSEETKRRLFDPFFSTKFPGRGLGLAATLGIVRGHHGTIQVESELGEGSRFQVLLPASDEPARGTAKAVELDDWHGHGVVLLADDEEIVRIVTERMLERLGFEVLLAEDGRAALELLRTREDVSLVLLDLTMPRLSGEETFREIRHLRPELPVVLTSGYSEQEASPRFAGEVLAGFIQKPFQLDSLRRVLRSALDG